MNKKSEKPPTPEQKVLLSLKIYRDRGEFDGSLASARTCLELAQFEWTREFAAIVRRAIGSPKIPEFPPHLQEEMRLVAQDGDYPYLTRMCVLWAPDTEPSNRAEVEIWVSEHTTHQ